MDLLNELKKEINETLEVEKQTYSDGAETDDVIKGWIEALEYVNGQIDFLNKSKSEPSVFDPITDDEQSKLNTIAYCYQITDYPANGNGVFSTAEVDDIGCDIDEDDNEIEMIYVDIVYGQQDDCHNESYNFELEIDRAKLNAWAGKGDFKHIIKGQE